MVDQLKCNGLRERERERERERDFSRLITIMYILKQC